MSYKSVKLSSKSVLQECQVRVSEKSVSQARVSQKSVKYEVPSKKCPTRVVSRSVLQEW